LLGIFMGEVVCTGMALRSALGNLAETWQGLVADRTAITHQQPWPDLPPLPLATIAEFSEIKISQRLNCLTNELGSALLADVNWSDTADCAVVLGSSRAYQSVWEAFAQSGIDATALDYLPQMAAIRLARQIGSTGAVLAPMAACATGIWAIDRGYQLIASGRAERAVVGAVETPLSPLTAIGFRQMGVLAKDGCYPFDRQRQGLVLGEGGALLALEDRAAAEARGAKIYGRVLGCAITNDANHPWGVGGGAGGEAVRRCLEFANLAAADIDYIHLHGTSTELNDRHEAQLVQQFCPGVAVGGSKGAVGHTLGASAAIGAVLTLQALQTQSLPPSVGCRELAFADLNLIRGFRPALLRQALCWSFGFGGQNAVLALGRYNDGSH
jgi:3-oxoacyl-[acyl-carrier-protein] synthase II